MQVARLTTSKNLFYLAVALSTLFVLYNNERFFLHDKTDPAWIHLRPVGGWIFLHGIPGAIALLTAPIQFSSRIRGRYPAFHRATGYPVLRIGSDHRANGHVCRQASKLRPCQLHHQLGSRRLLASLHPDRDQTSS